MDITGHNSLFELLGIYKSSAILVDCRELFLEIFDLVLVSHLHQHVHRRLFQLAHTLE
jgi:hypothetical protein